MYIYMCIYIYIHIRRRSHAINSRLVGRRSTGMRRLVCPHSGSESGKNIKTTDRTRDIFRRVNFRSERERKRERERERGTTGPGRTGHVIDRTVQDQTGPGRTRQDRTREEHTGQDRTTKDRARQDQTGPDRTRPDRQAERQACRKRGREAVKEKGQRHTFRTRSREAEGQTRQA